MTLKLTSFDVANYLTDFDEIQCYLEAELETNEPQYFAEALGSVARARGSVERMASETGIPLSQLTRAAAMEHEEVRQTVIQAMEAYKRQASASKVA